MIIIGHRGACGYVAENTLESFETALNMSVDMIEFDVVQCATGELVIMHDETVDRTTNGTGLIAHLDFEQIRQLRTHNNERVSTLAESFDAINRRCRINIELKGAGVAKPVAELCREYCANRGWQPTDFFVSSFIDSEVAMFHEYAPEIMTGVIFDTTDIIDYEMLKALMATRNVGIVCIVFPLLTHSVVKHLQALGLQVFVYTINKEDEMRFCIECGVDGIYSDYPDMMISMLSFPH